jgi:DNA-binding SARP family transcriptional activator
MPDSPMPDSSLPPPAPDAVACLHGDAHLRTAGGVRIALERKQALLLAYLWVEGPTPRGKLAALLWPEAGEARARGNLRQRLSMLRQRVGTALVADERGVLALSPLLEIEPPGPAAATLLASFDFDDCDDAAAWLDGQRESERLRQRTGLLAAVRAAVHEGRLDDALGLADQLLGLDRESEEAYRTQMEVLYLRGDTAAAIAVWDRCKEMLRQLYGVLPSAATRQLGETILSAARSAANTSRPASTAIPVTVLRPPRLIGRNGPLQAMLAGWHDGRAVYVSGEAGLGKSRLLADFAAEIGPCALASARPGDATVPYASLSRLLLTAIDRFEPSLAGDDARQAARLLPRLAALLTDVDTLEPVQTDFERRQCLRAVGRLLASCSNSGCRALLFDDLHFADLASVEAVVDMADSAGQEPRPEALRLVFGARGDELEPGVAAALESLGGAGRLMRIDLQPLTPGQVAELVESLGLTGFGADFAQRLWSQVGGNPAFVLESVKLVLALGADAASGSGALPLAPDIVAVIERRIGLLSPQARHLAQLAAIAGESWSVPLAAAALACEPMALSGPLRELELRQVLYGRQFVHDVIATAVRHTMAQSVAEFIHRFVAGYIEERGGEPARIAAHWLACGEDRRAGQAYLAAATVAADASRPVEQCQLLDAAAACFERAGEHDLLFDALEARQTISAAPDRAATRLARMTRIEALARTEEQRLKALLGRQGWESDHGHTESVDAGLDAIGRALALGRPGLACEFARPTAWRLAMRGDEAAAFRTLEAHRPWVMTHGSIIERAEFHSTVSGVLGFCDRLRPAIDAAAQAVAELRAAGHHASTLPMLSNMGLLLHWRGELGEAKTILSEAAVLRDRVHGRGSALVIDLHLGGVLRDRGEYAAAEAMLEAVLGEFRSAMATGGDLRTDVVIGESHLAQLWLSLGGPIRALDLLASDDAGIALRFRGRRMALRLRAARLQGRAEPALLAEAEAMVAVHDSPFNRTMLELEVACAWPAARALPVLVRLLGEPVSLERPGLLMHVAARAAAAELSLGHVAEAERYVRQVQDLLTRSAPFDIDRAEVWWIVAESLRAAGDAAAASAVLEQGGAWLRSTAQDGMREAWREGFLRGNAANRRLLAAAGSQ